MTEHLKAYEARIFAIAAHEGQADKAGTPYWNHLARVAGRAQMLMESHSDEVVQIAWLHDIIEDTGHTADDLRKEGFSAAVVQGVQDLTRPAGSPRPYLEWIEDIALNASLPTILVKIADIEDNSDPERLALLDEPTRERLKKKYGAALPILKEAAARLTAKDEGETR